MVVRHERPDPDGRIASLPVVADTGMVMRALVRMDPTAVDTSQVGAELEFFAGSACDGSSLATEMALPSFADTGGQFLPITWYGDQPLTAGSVRLTLFADADLIAPSAFSVWFDRASLAIEPSLFRDGFESGGTTAWSAATP